MDAEEPSIDQGTSFSRDEQVAFVVAASLVRFTGSIRDHRRALDAAQQSDRSIAAKPRDLEHLGQSLERQRRRRAEVAADKLMHRIREQFISAVPAAETVDQPPPTQQQKRHYPPGDEQLIAWLMGLIGPTAVANVTREFAKDCDEDLETARYAIAYAQWKYSAPVGDRVGAALVPATTSAFEELLAALVRLWLTLYPAALDVDKANMPVGVARGYRGGDDILRSAVDDKVRDVLKKSPVEWAAFLKRELHVSLGNLTERWDEVLEVFARRNIIVHWGGHVDDDYLERLSSHGPRPAVGDVLVTDVTYSRKAFDLFEHLGITLGVAWLAQLVPKGSVPAQYAADYLYSALKEHRSGDALIIANAVVRDRDLGELPGVVQVNWLMARRDAGKEDPLALNLEIEGWVPPDDDPDYLIAKAALLRDEDQLVSLIEGRLRKEPDALRSVTDWPLLVDMAERSPRIGQLLQERRTPPRKQQRSAAPTWRRHRR